MLERLQHCLTTALGTQLVRRRDLDGVSDNFLAGRAAELYRYAIEETKNLPGPDVKKTDRFFTSGLPVSF